MNELYVCTARKGKKCRKKFCTACLQRLYAEEWLEKEHSDELAATTECGYGWTCPSCSHACVCAGCERKAVGAEVPAHKRRGRNTATTAGPDTVTATVANVANQSMRDSSPYPSPPVARLLSGGLGMPPHSSSGSSSSGSHLMPSSGGNSDSYLSGVETRQIMAAVRMPPNQRNDVVEGASSDGSTEWLRGLNSASQQLDRSKGVPAKRVAQFSSRVPEVDPQQLQQLQQKQQQQQQSSCVPSPPARSGGPTASDRAVEMALMSSAPSAAQFKALQTRQQQQQQQPLVQQVQQVRVPQPLQIHSQPMVAPPATTLDFLFSNLQQHSTDPTSAGYLQARQLLEEFIQRTATAASLQHVHSAMHSSPQALAALVNPTPSPSPYTSVSEQPTPFSVNFGSRWPSSAAMSPSQQMGQQQQQQRPRSATALAHVLQPQPPFW